MTKQHIDPEKEALRDLCIHATKLGLYDFYVNLLAIDGMSTKQMRDAIDVAARSNSSSSANASDGEKERQAARQKAIAQAAWDEHYSPSIMAPQAAKDALPEFVGGTVEEQLLAIKGAAAARRLWVGPPSRTN